MKEYEELDQLREIFVAKAEGLDDDEKADNEAKIREWEQALLRSEALHSWREHDLTKQIIRQAKTSYLDISLQLLGRTITDDTRRRLWAQQDAMLWLIQLASGDPKQEIERIKNEIRTAINTTN